MGLSAAGLGIATYLVVVHAAGQPIACNGVGSCDYVNSSEYSNVAGVPVALLGALAYAAILALVAAAWRRADAALLTWAWGLALASFAFSAWLTYVELFVIDAICVYCVASATCVTGLLAVLSATLYALRRGPSAARRPRSGTRAAVPR
jgi:uncharacterized membrane protein